jgi:hypothetical protein
MKKVLVLIGGLLITGALCAEHIHLSSPTKCVCSRKRLEMSKSHLCSAKAELGLLEENGLACERDFLESHETRISELKEDIRQLEIRIPIIEKSLHALCKTIK